MHTTTAVASRLAKAIADGVGTEDRVSVSVCPPFPSLHAEQFLAIVRSGIDNPYTEVK